MFALASFLSRLLRPPMPFQTAALSSPGGRETNQDATAHTTDGACGCWVLADGLGGHAAGEVAAEAATEAAVAAYRAHPALAPEALTGYIAEAEQAVMTRQQAAPHLSSMRTTLVVLVVEEGAARWAHVGDSRLYAFRDGRVAAQTRDHSVPQALAAAGEIRADEIRHHPERNRLLRALGGSEPAKAAVSEPAEVRPGDAFLLCSDGLWELVEDAEMEAALAAADAPDAWLAAMEQHVLARASGHHDNYTALAVFVT